MKNKLFIALAIFSMHFSNSIYAGGFGIKGGIGLTSLSFEEDKASDIKNRMKLGGQVGFSYEKKFKKVVALDIEAGLANKGVQQKNTTTILGNEITSIVKTNLYTFDVPVSAKFYIGDNVNFNIGPYYSFIIAAQNRTIVKTDGDKEKKDGENWFNDEFKDANGNHFLNRHDVGLNAGVEFVTDGGFGVGARLQKGLLDLTNKDFILGDDKWVTNTALQVYGIIRF